MSKSVVKVSILLVLLLLLVVISSYFFVTPRLILDKKDIELNVFDEYTPIKYKAMQLTENLTDQVKVDGIVDTEHIGTYKITYTLQKDTYNLKKVLTVNVVDKISPSISLVNGSKVLACSIDKYKDDGYIALDNYDGDITDKVEINKIDDNTLEYKVKDSSNNEAKTTRTIEIGDIDKPTITLKDKQTITITQGNKYEEPGYKAEDNCEGDITSKVVVSGNVDASKTGTYEIEYKVKDNYNNETSVKRTVKVIEKQEKVETPSNDNYNANGAVIYLTFDDGPGGYTGKILDTLAKHNVKATFFVTSSGSDSLILREYQEGHTVALHTYTHDWNIYRSVDTYLDDLNKIATRVKNITGQDSKYIRFPGGSTNQKIYYRSNNTITIKDLIREIEARGYKYFDWNVSVEDAGGCAYSKKDKSDCVFNNFKKYISPNRSNIVLLHDIKSYTAEALDRIITYAKERGYTFKRIDDSTPVCHYTINN